MKYEEIVEAVPGNGSETQRALNTLWRDGEVSHTLDRRFRLKGDDSG